MPKNDVLELYDHPPTWIDVIPSGFTGLMGSCVSIGLVIPLFTQENQFFEIILAIIMIAGFGFVGMALLSKAYQDRLHIGGERKLRYSFSSAGLTDHTTGQNFLWDDFLAIKGNAKNGLKFNLKKPLKTIYLYQGFIEEQRQEVIGFLKVCAPHEKTLWLG